MITVGTRHQFYVNLPWFNSEIIPDKSDKLDFLSCLFILHHMIHLLPSSTLWHPSNFCVNKSFFLFAFLKSFLLDLTREEAVDLLKKCIEEVSPRLLI